MRSPQPRYSSTWDVSVVLNYIESMQEDEAISILHLSYKLSTLMILMTAARSLELQKLKISRMIEDKTKFIIDERTKTQREHHKPVRMIFYKNQISLKLEVVSSLQCYLKRIKENRKEEDHLFITTTAPFRATRPTTIANWVKHMMTLAGIDTKLFRTHSCRAAATLKAKVHGLSIEQTISVARWSNVKTFKRFYERELRSENSFQETLATK
ncbi:unnamed protein product [Didymodactylos carnosus]|uniref:Tyr recombinase domain-containing protein n=1 Tax=Didymodactylos carnosus TaxID=1234261 RepID=A0A815NB77_9BILA|nr:unnamed protein product [Didymodactylos carnosus]CAF1435875.1 unnamed protein product [Didymodactylos carnosus]CAF4152840.1 unnamed protein product [Didymodactylos carnosus]CAF4313413.1 unnamed protein product [Didymodactylos carnosus]